MTDETDYRILEQARFAPSGGLGWREYSEHVALNLVPFAPSQDGSWHGPANDLARAREVEHPHAFGDHLDEVPLALVVAESLPGSSPQSTAAAARRCGPPTAACSCPLRDRPHHDGGCASD